MVGVYLVDTVTVLNKPRLAWTEISSSMVSCFSVFILIYNHWFVYFHAPQENHVPIPILVSAPRPISVPSLIHYGNPLKESQLRQSSLEDAGLRVSWKWAGAIK